MAEHLGPNIDRILSILNGLARVSGESGEPDQVKRAAQAALSAFTGVALGEKGPSTFVRSYDESDVVQLLSQITDAALTRARRNGVTLSATERTAVENYIANTLFTKDILSAANTVGEAFANLAITDTEVSIRRFPNHALSGMQITAIARGALAADDPRISQEIFDAIQFPTTAASPEILAQAIEFSQSVRANLPALLRTAGTESGQLPVASRKVVEADTARLSDPDNQEPSQFPQFAGLGVPEPRRVSKEDLATLESASKLRAKIKAALPKSAQLDTKEEKDALARFVEDTLDEVLGRIKAGEESGLSEIRIQTSVDNALDSALRNFPSVMAQAVQAKVAQDAQEEQEKAAKTAETDREKEAEEFEQSLLFDSSGKTLNEFIQSSGGILSDITPQDRNDLVRQVQANQGVVDGIKDQLIESFNQSASAKRQADFDPAAAGRDAFTQFAFDEGFLANTITPERRQEIERFLSAGGEPAEVAYVITQLQQEKRNIELRGDEKALSSQVGDFLGIERLGEGTPAFRALSRGAASQLTEQLGQGLARDPFADPGAILEGQFRQGAITPLGTFAQFAQAPPTSSPFTEEQVGQLLPSDTFASDTLGRFAETGLPLREQLEAVQAQFDPTQPPTTLDLPTIPLGGLRQDLADLPEGIDIERILARAAGEDTDFLKFLRSPDQLTGVLQDFQREAVPRIDEAAFRSAGGADTGQNILDLFPNVPQGQVLGALRQAATIQPPSFEDFFGSRVAGFRESFELQPSTIERRESEVRDTERQRELDISTAETDRRKLLRRGGRTTIRRLGI